MWNGLVTRGQRPQNKRRKKEWFSHALIYVKNKTGAWRGAGYIKKPTKRDFHR